MERRIKQANGFEFGLNSMLAEGMRVFVGFVGFVKWGFVEWRQGRLSTWHERGLLFVSRSGGRRYTPSSIQNVL